MLSVDPRKPVWKPALRRKAVAVSSALLDRLCPAPPARLFSNCALATHGTGKLNERSRLPIVVVLVVVIVIEDSRRLDYEDDDEDDDEDERRKEPCLHFAGLAPS